MTKIQNGNALQALLEEKIGILFNAFCDNSRKLFLDTNGKLVHPGEFGVYRENVVKEYLGAFIPQRMGIDSGFVVSSNGMISGQCDLIIYDRSVTPLLQNSNRQKFFPIESVCAVGEVKSIVSLEETKTALLKLASVKSFRDYLWEPTYFYNSKVDGLKSKYEPQHDPKDQIITFLICEKFSFNISANIKNLLSCYSEQHPHRPANLRQNFILSMNDGFVGYLHPSNSLFPYPLMINHHIDYAEENNKLIILQEKKNWNRLATRLILPMQGSFEHIRQFSALLHQSLPFVSVLFPDMAKYIGAIDDTGYLDVDYIP